MKKILALVLALMLVAALCACNSGNGNDTTATTTAPTTEGSTTAADSAADTTVADNDETTEADTTDELIDDPGDDDELVYLDEALFLDDDVTNPKTGNAFGRTAQQLAPGESVATKFTITVGEIAGIKIGCPSWNDNKGTLTLSIYRWVEGTGKNEKAELQDGYAKTVASEPILSQTFESFADNETLALYLDALGLGEGGTYLAVLFNPDEEDLGVGYQKSGFDARDYYGALKYQLPDDLVDYGYDPQFTTDVVAFNTVGVPATKGYASFVVEVTLSADQAADYVD